MKKTQLISAAALAAASLFAAQSALAYQAGDIYVRGGYAKSDFTSSDASGMDKENGFTYGLGYVFTDQLGVELNGSEKIEHSLKDGGSFDRMPINLMLNYFPMGGTDSRIQPYAGVGLNYTRFSGESLPAGQSLSYDSSYSPAAQVGVDFAVTDNILVGAFANYVDLDSDYTVKSAGGARETGKTEFNPVTIGGGVTLRF